MTLPNIFTALRPAGGIRPVTPSRAIRRQMLGVDLCRALIYGYKEIPEVRKARLRLEVLVGRVESLIGTKMGGGWVYKKPEQARSYARTLTGVMGYLRGLDKEDQSGVLWFVAGLGWGELCFEEAEENSKAELAKAWRKALRVLSWMYARYENDPDDYVNYGLGLSLFEGIKKHSEVC